MALDFGNKVENGGIPPQGVLSASEFNQLVAQVNKNESDIASFDEPNSIESITVTESSTSGGTNVVTITETNGTETTVNIKNGEDGVDLGQVAIADNCNTNDATKVLSAKQGYELKRYVDGLIFEKKEYGIDDATENYNYNLSDSTAPATPRSVSGWSCIRIGVEANNVVEFKTLGGQTSARAYALTDIDRNILELANPSSSIESYSVTPTQDGYLYINCKSEGYSSFEVVCYKENHLTVIKDEVEDVKSDLYRLSEFGASDLEEGSSGQFWKLASSGTPVATAPSSVSTYTATGYWACVPEPIPVKEGDVVTISTAGGGNARAWAFTDSAKNLLTNDDSHEYVAAANKDTTASPYTITVGRSGYLYVNFNLQVASTSNFYVNVERNVIDGLAATVDTLSATVDGITSGTPHYKNNPLPLWKDSLKVLAIANSFMVDGLAYMQDFINASGIDNSKICFYGCYRSSGSLSIWNDIYNAGAALSSNSATCIKYAGGIDMGVGNSNTLKQILAHDWDVILFQQVSGGSDQYSTYEPYLTKLVGYARENCTNQKVAMGWQMTWSYLDSHTVSGPHGVEGWKGICNTVKKMISNNGIDIIVPTGTAIQNARNSSINTNGGMTRDGAHLAYGVGRYVATSTWWQTLVAPIFGESVLANTAIHEITQDETSDYAAVAVTSSNRAVCQKCAFYATIDMWNITQV